MKKSNRRGVLLLVVLALLAMFAMVAVAFVVLTNAEKVVSDRMRTVDAVSDPAPKLLNQAADVVFRGVPIDPTGNTVPTSAITWPNLLEKIYGFKTIGTLNFPASMSQTTPICEGQLIEFTLPSANPDATLFPNDPVDPFHCVGCVVTMLTGPAAGLSTRIVGINPLTRNVQMAAFDGGVEPQKGDRYIVNGFPYSGMGFGFDPTSGGLSKLSLLPNSSPLSWIGAKGMITGGVNSDYTAADYQDPLLALAISNTNGSISVPIPSLQRSDLIAYTAAAQSVSGNPALQQTWVKWAGPPTSPKATILRSIWFRPNPLDHPAFCASVNPNFNPVWDGITAGQGAWDVDNDGDGIPDSVWTDLGMPVRYTTDGRAYKPLFAILCLDMDGRLNLNAHSSLAQAENAYYQPRNVQQYQPLTKLDVGLGTTLLPPALATTVRNQAYFAGQAGSALATPPIALPRGQGSGPAEVSLLPLFRDPTTPGNFFWTNYQELLWGGGGYMGRYGMPIGSAVPGLSGTGSLLTLNKAFPYSGILGGNNDYWTNFQTIFDAHGSPPDHQTMGLIGLDRAGRPLYISMGGSVVNGPYDIDLTPNAPHAVDQATVNNPFGVAEFERLLRPYDHDTPTLPQRLAALTLTNSGSILEPRRAEFTTESWRVPVASAVLPPGLRFLPNGQALLPNKQSEHPVDVLYAQIAKNNGGDPKKVIAQLLPWEVMQGLKMDLNRSFGSGTFSTPANGTLTQGGTKTIPDQPGTTGEQVKQYGAGRGVVAAQHNYSADAGAFSTMVYPGKPPVPVTDSLAARQLYARHLYVLALALADTDAILADLKKTNSAATSDDVARMLAQWAVNVVAYRDHNGIMIPFPYDPNPFSGKGWNPPPNPPYNTPANIVKYTVWGCKRPELLITETLAFHDRRTQDLNNEVVDPKKPGASPKRSKPGLTTSPAPNTDPGFNSAFRPQGSLFLEFYNPWTITEPRTTDLGPNPPTGPGWSLGGVELTKKTPVVTVNGKPASSPVWRIVIVVPKAIDPAQIQNAIPTNNGDELPDPDNPILANRPTIERAGYFVNLSGMTTPGDGQVSYCPSGNNARSVVVPPSGYAVIGSGDIAQANRTYIGFERGSPPSHSTSTTRMVTLNPGDLTAANPWILRNIGAVQPAVPVPQVLGIDAGVRGNNTVPQRLSVSEPTMGYVPYEKDGKGMQASYAAASGQYNETLDIPVDWQRELQPNLNAAAHEGTIKVWTNYLSHNATFPAYRIIYLQRLADPTRPWVSDIPSPTNNNPQLWNPYRTIDAMTVDLTTFNGMSAPHSPIDPTSTTPAYHFEAHQRGEKNYLPGSAPAAGQVGEADLWKQEPADKSQVGVGWTNGGAIPKGTHYFTQPLNQTLGYLNQPYGPPAKNPSGDAQYPFPWLNWSYRPFNNEYELLLVPMLSSSRLLARNRIDPRRYYNYVDNSVRKVTTNGGGYTPQDVYDYDGSTSNVVPYPHLLNFFASKQSSKFGPNNPAASAQLHRLFSYVGVPSRFANVQLQMRPDLAAKSGAGIPAHYFHTPFNWISRYREPGGINLNTVTSSDVLMGAMNMYFPELEQNLQLYPAFWDKFVRSRREAGFGKATTNPTQTLTNMLAIDNKAPSRFMRPFRTPGGAFLTAVPPPAVPEPARETDVTLLRGDPDAGNRPLFEVDDGLAYVMNNQKPPPVGSPDQFPLACMDYNRNPYFRYQAIRKLGSVFSNHSNVFAVWITVGYFEVTPNQKGVDAGHPDGWQLGPELGSDTGDIVRHRAFYIFDRSIPVGFIRGKDINHEKALLLSRFIE